MAKIIWKKWVLEPIWHALVAWGCTILFIMLLIATDTGREYAFITRAGFGILIIGIIWTAIAIFVGIRTYRRSEKHLSRLILLFLSACLIFANIYFLLIFSFELPFFEGVESPWESLRGLEGRRLTIGKTFNLIFDCLHYSWITITTLGFGEILPIHWVSKLLTDLEVLAGLYILIIGFGRLWAKN